VSRGRLRTNGVKSVAWIEVDLDAIRDNFLTARSIVGNDTKICAVVKADAYGHGVCEVAPTLEKAGADYFAVAILDEAIELRKMGIEKPILVLGPLMPGQASYVLRYNITQTICSLEMAEELSREAFRDRKPAKIHIKIDTGMGRIGAYYEDAVAMISKIKDLPYLNIEGIFTHYATADSQNKDYVYEQWNNFTQVLEDLKSSGINIPISHVATSSTIIDNPEMKLDMVRPGLMLYGLYPRSSQREVVNLKPALTYKAKISFLKDIAKRRSISYSRKYFASVGEKIATLPLGYNDGIRRILSNQGEVIIKGKRCPMVGTICMDHIMADVTQLSDVKRFDEAVLIGKQGEEEIPVDELAKKLNTINYEITSCLGKRVPRIYLSGGKRVAVRNLLGYHSDTILPYDNTKDDLFCLNGSSLQ